MRATGGRGVAEELRHPTCLAAPRPLARRASQVCLLACCLLTARSVSSSCRVQDTERKMETCLLKGID